MLNKKYVYGEASEMESRFFFNFASLLGNAGQDEPMLPENLDSEWMEL